jgi:hypothetical protein
MKLLPALCSARTVVITLAVVAVLISTCGEIVHANSYLAKPGEPPLKARIGTCAVTDGFIHLYAALDNRVFNKYGISAEHVVLRGGVVAVAALGADESSHGARCLSSAECRCGGRSHDNGAIGA